MTTTHKTDYEQQGVTLLREAHRGRPLTEALLRAQLRAAQRLEDAIQQLASPYDIDGASGARLDAIGSIFGLARNGLADDAYRLLLHGKIAASRGNGLLPDLERAALALFQASRVYVYAPTSAGAGAQAAGGAVGVMVGSPKLPSSLYPLARKLLAPCLPAGVSLAFLGTFDAAESIVFDSPSTAEAGFDAGRFAALIS